MGQCEHFECKCIKDGFAGGETEEFKSGELKYRPNKDEQWYSKPSKLCQDRRNRVAETCEKFVRWLECAVNGTADFESTVNDKALMDSTKENLCSPRNSERQFFNRVFYCNDERVRMIRKFTSEVPILWDDQLTN